MQDVISACWAGSPEERPSAPALVQKLTELVPVVEEMERKCPRPVIKSGKDSAGGASGGPPCCTIS